MAREPRLWCTRGKMIFSVAEGAAYLGCSAATLYRRIASGQLRSYSWGARHVLLRPDLDRFARDTGVRKVMGLSARGHVGTIPHRGLA